MAVILTWTTPIGSDWTHSRIYTSSSIDGTYSLLTTIAIGTYTYTHTAGDSDTYYKISYWDGTNESSLSEPMQGGETATYTTDSKVRSLTGVTTTEISESNMGDIIVHSSRIVTEYMDNARYHWEYFKDRGNDRILQMNDATSFQDIVKVEIDGKELFEFEKEELMDNCEFDEGDASDDTVEDFTYLTGTSYSTFTWDTSNPYKGARSLKLVKTDNETSYWYSTDNIDIDEPTDFYIPYYRLSAYIKTDSITAGTGSGAYLQIAWYDSSDTLISTNDSSAATDTQDYTSTTVSAYAPWNAAYAVARFVHDGSAGTAWFDVASFRKVNWQDDTTNARLELTRTAPDSQISVRYEMSSTRGIVEELTTLFACRETMLRMVGKTSTGMKYRLDELTVDKGSLGNLRLSMLKTYNEDIDRILGSLGEYGDLKDVEDDFGLIVNE